MAKRRSVVVLTGAGISAESGLPTFRGAGGVWEGYRAEDVASVDAFERDPDLVHRFYNLRRGQLISPDIKPNAAHFALSAFEREFAGEFLLVTQNVDHLHERAGSVNLIHMHGELLKKRCRYCTHVSVEMADIGTADSCEKCGRPGGLRPHVVWFGEMPLQMGRIYQALEQCDVFVAAGTSGSVYPAAGFVDVVNAHGGHCVEINLAPSAVNTEFAQAVYGPASETLPNLLNQLRNEISP